MNPIRRLTAALAGLAGALLAFAAAAPAALADPFPPRPPGWDKHPTLPLGQQGAPVMGPNRAGYPPISRLHTVVVGGIPGWQIALIAIGAALLAATVAVLLDRAGRAPQDDHRGFLSRARRLAEAGERMPGSCQAYDYFAKRGHHHAGRMPDLRRGQRVTGQRARAASGGRPRPPQRRDSDPASYMDAARR